MKSTLITRIFACVILSVSFFSCETEDLYSKSNESFKTAGLTAGITSETILLDYTNCDPVCIEAGSGVYYKISDVDTKSSGGGQNVNTKEVSYEAYNTETEFIVNVTYDVISGNSNAKADITITINGNALLIEDVEKGNTVSHSIALPENWEACDEMPFSILQEGLGSPISFDASYALVAVCPEGCEESFSYEKNEDNSYTFTYISAEDLNAAEVKFTSPHIVGFEALDGKVYDVNPGNGKGSPTVLTWTGDIEACTEITFTLAFEADCEQNNAGFANIFTDFKVNEVSKKGDNPNIQFECSIEE